MKSFCESVVTNDNKLNRSLVETIAGQWKRLNIETVEEAMNFTESEHKKIKAQVTKTKTKKTVTIPKKQQEEQELPAWFNQNNDLEEPTQEESQQMQSRPKEMFAFERHSF